MQKTPATWNVNSENEAVVEMKSWEWIQMPGVCHVILMYFVKLVTKHDSNMDKSGLQEGN